MSVRSGSGPSTGVRGLDGASLPTISVVIPVLNEARSIANCLDAVLAQDYPSHLVEILVVDGGSRDDTRAVVERHRHERSRIRLLDNPSGVIPAGLNIGIRVSQGEVIARVDARAKLAPDYLSKGIRLLQESGASNVGGPVRATGLTYMGRALALVTESPFGMGGAAIRYRESDCREVDTVYLGLYPRAVLAAVGLYDEELVRDQDDELNFRLRSRGGRIIMSPELRTTYDNSPSLTRFIRQNFLYGYWKVRVAQKHPRMMSWRHLVPPLFTLAVLGGALLALASAWGGSVWAVGIGAYALGAAGAALAAGSRNGWRFVPILPVLFAILHVSWGLGFLVGLFRFLPRWFRPEVPPPSLSSALADQWPG